MMGGSSLGIEIRQATAVDVPNLADVLARAFADGPITRWHVPDDERRVDTMARFFAAGLEYVFLPHGEVYTTSGELAGCCIWMPPGAESVRDDGTAAFDDACEHIFREFPRTFELFAIMAEIHRAEPRYYLPFVGVDPMTQRQGVGRALLAPGLAKCDREGIAAYLEADDRSKPWHERNGFEIIREVRLPNGPSLWSMERKPGPTE
jgi:ribosomal protein S18 acetylase RimI-like enzyme